MTRKPFTAIHQIFYLVFYFCIFTILISCSDDKEQHADKELSKQINLNTSSQNNLKDITISPTPKEVSSTTKTTQPETHKKVSMADWDKIKNNGTLRIIVPYFSQQNLLLPRNSSSYNNELKLIIRFCEEHNLTPVIITAKKFSNLLPSLEEGLGDIVVANLTITDARKDKIKFTNPLVYASEQLVVAKSFKKKISKGNLTNIKIGARKHTSFMDTLVTIKEKQPQIQIVELADNILEEDKYNILLSGHVEAIIEDSNRLSLIQEYRKDIKPLFNLTKERPIAWAVRNNNPVLLKQLNQFITTEKLLQHLPETRLGDLNSIKKNRQLRLITRNNASTYFLWKNQLMGFEYDLIKKFAKQQKVNLKVLVANDYQQMFDWLEQGYGDIISAGLIKTEKRSQRPVLFTDPYLFVQQVVVQRIDDKSIKSTQDFKDRTFHVRKSSSYWNNLKKIQEQLIDKKIPFSINLVDETVETEEIIQSVINGQFDLTVADSHIVAIEQSWQSQFQAHFTISGEQGHRWIVRESDKNLHQELNKFIKKQYKGLFYNVTYNKYFKNSRKLFNAKKRDINNKKISAYDDLIKTLSKKYHFDWRLIAAQVNKESQFNPNAKSWAGAKGLLQVMPRTAREVGITKLEKPENGLKAGIKYMDWIRSQLSNELPADVKMWFTLAAYNAGLGHLKDARSLARKQGLNPDRWFGHVEKTFLLLSKPKYHKTARYGYVRGIEPVTYVKHIQALYELYSKKHPNGA